MCSQTVMLKPGFLRMLNKFYFFVFKMSVDLSAGLGSFFDSSVDDLELEGNLEENKFFSSVYSSGDAPELDDMGDLGVDTGRTFNNYSVSEDSEDDIGGGDGGNDVGGALVSIKDINNTDIALQAQKDLLNAHPEFQADFNKASRDGQGAKFIAMSILATLLKECESERQMYSKGNLSEYAKQAYNYVKQVGDANAKDALYRTTRIIFQSGGRIMRNYDMFMELLRYEINRIGGRNEIGPMKITLPSGGGTVVIKKTTSFPMLTSRIMTLRNALQRVTASEVCDILTASNSFIMMAQSVQTGELIKYTTQLREQQENMRKQIMDQNSMKNFIEKLQNQLNYGYNQYDMLYKNKKELEIQHSSVLRELDLAKQSLQYKKTTIDSFNGLIKKMEDTFGALSNAENTKNEEIRTSLEELKGKYENLVDSNKSIAVSCEGYKNSLAEMTGKYTALNGLITTINSTLGTVSIQTASMKGVSTELENLTSAVSSLKTTIESVKKKIDEENLPGVIADSISKLESAFASQENTKDQSENIQKIVKDLQSSLIDAIDKKTLKVDLSKVSFQDYIKPTFQEYVPIISEAVSGKIVPEIEKIATKEEVGKMIIENGKVYADAIIKEVANSSATTQRQLSNVTEILKAFSTTTFPSMNDAMLRNTSLLTEKLDKNTRSLLEKIGAIEKSVSSLSSSVATLASAPPPPPPPQVVLAPGAVNEGAAASEQRLSVKTMMEIQRQVATIGETIATILSNRLPAIVAAPVKTAEVPIEWFQTRYHLPSIATREEVFRKWVPWIMNKSRSVHTPISQRHHGMVEVRGKDKDPFVDPTYAAKEVKRRSVARQDRIVKRRKKDAVSFFSMLF